VLKRAAYRSGCILLVWTVVSCCMCLAGARADTDIGTRGSDTVASPAPNGPANPSGPADPTAPAEPSRPASPADPSAPADPSSGEPPSQPAAPAAPAPPTAPGTPGTTTQPAPIASEAPSDATGNPATTADAPTDSTVPASPSGDAEEPAGDPRPTRAASPQQTPAVVRPAPVVVPTPEALQPTRTVPARDLPTHSAVTPTRDMAGPLGRRPWFLVSTDTGASWAIDADPTAGTRVRVDDDLGNEARLVRAPRRGSHDSSANRPRGGSDGGRSKAGGSSGVGSTSTAGSGSASGSGAADMIVLVTFAGATEAATKLLVSPARWRSLTLISLLERPG
jgi:hypothetical protein